MIERFHRTLKASLMCQRDTSWVNVLPTVLLGLRTAHKKDINVSPAEILFGQKLRLPGEMIDETKVSPNQYDFTKSFSKVMRSLAPTPVAHHTNEYVFLNKSLSSCSHVFVRVIALKPPL